MPASKHKVILTEIQTKVKKKSDKNELFLAADSVSKNNELRTINYEMSTDLRGKRVKYQDAKFLNVPFFLRWFHPARLRGFLPVRTYLQSASFWLYSQDDAGKLFPG